MERPNLHGIRAYRPDMRGRMALPRHLRAYHHQGDMQISNMLGYQLSQVRLSG